MRQTLNTLILLGLALTLSACGFALRGSQQSAMAIDTLALHTVQDNSLFLQQLRTALAAADVSTVASERETYILNIGAEQTDTRTASVNGRARAAQYELQLAVEISLERDDIILFGPEMLSASRTYFEDITNISGSNEERELLISEMRRELVEQVLARLRVAETPTGAQ